jgi:hypothetical protein
MSKYQIALFRTILPLLLLCIPSLMMGQFFPTEAVAVEPKEPAEFFAWTITQFDSVFFVRLAINLLSMIVLLRLIYYRVTGRHDFFLTFFMFNLVIFIITILLNTNSGFSIGAAFGLFAIFAMLRYRTEDISVKDMTYLFLSITIGLISSINQGTAVEIVLINAVILLVAFLIEGGVLIKQEFIKTIEYENIELIKPERHDELMADLKNRTGLDIHKVYIKRIDFLRDTALIKVHYRSAKSQND